MLLKNKLLILSSVLVITLLFQECDKNWNDHYNTLDQTTEKDKIILEMEKIPEISEFTEAVKQWKYLADYLGQNRLYTVFAPVNGTFDSISKLYSNNEDLFANIILYHFADGKYKNKDLSSGFIQTFNSKYLNISINTLNKVVLDNSASIIDPDNLSSNGIIQVIDKPLIPLPNLNEFFKFNQNYNKIEESIQNYTTKQFNPDASTPVSVNESGQVVYDSVFNVYNPFLYTGSEDKVGSFYGINRRYINITDEDLKFTGIIPANFSDAIKTVNESPALLSKISDEDLAGPILANFILNGSIPKNDIIASIDAYHQSTYEDTLILFHFADLLENNLQETDSLSNGIVYVVDGMTYNLAWLIKDQGNIGADQKESEYRSQLLASLTYSQNIDTIFISSSNIKTVFYESDNDTNYTSSLNEWVNFEVLGDFYPVNYKVMVRGRNFESGIYKVEADGKEIGQYNFSASYSGDLDTKFNLIGIVGFAEKKSLTNLKFTFIGSHNGANLGHQYLWIREIKFVPVLD